MNVTDPAAPPPTSPFAAVVVNPVKAGDGLPEIERVMAELTATAGWAPPRLWETTPEDVGAGQAREALDAGAALVVAAGGDGTVRAVASVVAGTGTPMAVLPMGTGNLLARNLGIPLDPQSAAKVAVNGEPRRIDVARLRLHRESGQVDEETGVVMSGVGFDAEVIQGTGDALKSRIGWGAYVAAGLRRLAGHRFPVRLTLDDEPTRVTRVRSVMIAVAGELTAGIKLIPDAEMDDGQLEVISVAPRGVIGWLSVIWWALRDASRPHHAVSKGTACRVVVELQRPMPVEVDGDPAGHVRRLEAAVEPRSLIVRVPA